MNKEIIKTSLAFLFSVLVFFLIELISKNINIDRFYNVFENLLFAFFCVILSVFIKSTRIRKIYVQVIFIIFNVCLFLETFYYYNFNGVFNNSTLYVMFETNSAEAGEFFKSYINRYFMVLSLILLISLVFGLKILNNNLLKPFVLNPTKKIRLFLLLLFIFSFLKFTKLILFNVPYLMVMTPISYYKEIKGFDNYSKMNFQENFTDVRHKNSKNLKELNVIIVGESTNRLHFQLYNQYYRETTPLLNEVKNDLVVLKNVISPHAYTIGSLTKVLTLGNSENPENKSKGSIIQLLNMADYKTYWISNQRPLGISDTQVTKIAKGSHKSIFLNTNHTSDQTPFDEVLLKELNKVVEEKGDKKVVFLHMLGAHFFYENRYPPEFNFFTDIPKTKFKRRDVFNTINAYDNVMRYTDSILSEVIKTVSKQEISSFVLYFSDHGQEVFDEIDFFGQTIDQMITKNMFEIPTFLWTNDIYNQNKTITNNDSKKYMTDDMIHAIADLCNISSNEIDSTRSIFNSNFRERKRLIKDTIDYDVFFK